MTYEERVRELHRRMAARQRRKENLRTWAMGASSLILFTCLLTLVGSTGLIHRGATAGLYTGAILLFESAGSYVLTALAAFTAGVVSTVILKRHQGKGKGVCPEETHEKAA